MFNEYIYIIKVYDNDDTHEYEYGNLKHAVEHYEVELSKQNKPVLFRSKDETLERYHERTNTWG